MKKTKIMALLLSGVMLASVFAGCGKKTANYATIDGQATNGDLFESYTRYQISMFTSQGADADQIREYLKQETGEEGKTYADTIKENSLAYLKTIAAIQKLAKDNDITLTSDEKKTIKDQKNEQITQMGGRSKFVESLKQQHMSEEVYDSLQEFGALQQKVMSALFNKGGKYAVSEEEIVSKVLDGNIRVRHILVQAQETDEDYAEKQKKANEILARVKGGEDFETVLTEVGEDPGMKSYPNGYVFNEAGVLVDSPSTTFDKTFTAESFKLDVNQISGIVKSTSGLHIIKRLPLDEAFVKENIDSYYSAFASEAFQAKVTEIMNALDVKTTDEYTKLDVSTYIETADATAGSTTGGTTGGSTGGTTGGTSGGTTGGTSGDTTGGTSGGTTGGTSGGTTGGSANGSTGGTSGSAATAG